MNNSLHLKKQLCFPIYALSKEIIRRYTPFLERLDLTYPQYLVMMVLWENEPQTVSEIGTKLFLDSGTLTPLLKRLQAKGLIERQRSSQDERSVIIQLTETGRALEQQAVEIPEQLAGCLKLDNDEIVVLRKLVTKFLNQISEQENK